MQLLIHCLIAVLAAGILCQLTMSMVPRGAARQVLLICIAAGAGIFCISRLARAAVVSPDHATVPAPRSPLPKTVRAA